MERLAQLHRVSNDANAQGSAYQDGWYGYVEKDLRRLLGHTVRGPYATQFCGAGNLDSCRESLWAALEQACDLLQAKQGAEPTAWRADARPERIGFTTGLITRHDGLDEPADLPAGDVVLGTPKAVAGPIVPAR